MSTSTLRRTIFTTLGGLALAACGGGSDPSPPAAPSAPPSVEREISPALTNPALTQFLAPHFAVNPSPSVAPAQRLFVMLPGTGATPRVYREIVRVGAQRGHHALGLTYPNNQTVGAQCLGQPDPDCTGKARREVITGEDTSPVVAIDPANSIDGRLRALLAHLAASFPDEGWGQFLAGGQIDWSRVTVAGHSQGAGHAGYMAKMRALHRVVVISGPGDVGQTPGVPAPWLSLPNVTPAARQYGFTHTGDTLVPLALALRNWELMGLGASGAPANVDGAGPPFGNTRQLVTSLAPNPNPPAPVPAPEHAAPVADAATPRTAEGDPVFRSVWIYLAFP